MSRPRPSARARLINAVLIAVAFGLLGVTVYSNRDAIQRVIDRRPDLSLFGLGFVLYLAGLLSTFVRWWLLVRVAGLEMRIRDAVRLGFIGNVFNLVIPGAVGGDLIKAAYLFHEHPGQKTEAAASIAIDRIVGLLGLFMLGSIAGALYWSGARADVRSMILLIWGAVAAGLAGLAVLFTPAIYRPIGRFFPAGGKLDALFHRLVEMAAAYRSRLGTVATTLGMAMGNHTLNVLTFYLAGVAMFGDETPTLTQHFLLVPLVLFSTAVPLPFGALGLSELISKGLFQLVNHPDGAIGMMGFRLLMYGGGLVSVLVYLANLRQVRSLEAEIEHARDEAEPLPASELQEDPAAI